MRQEREDYTYENGLLIYDGDWKPRTIGTFRAAISKVVFLRGSEATWGEWLVVEAESKRGAEATLAIRAADAQRPSEVATALLNALGLITIYVGGKKHLSTILFALAGDVEHVEVDVIEDVEGLTYVHGR